MVLLHVVDLGSARQLAAQGSLSGAIAGGLIFGVGMVMARGCPSRLLILSANGNLRSLLTGLVFAVTTQAALFGALLPVNKWISSWWVVDGGAARDLLSIAGVGHGGGLVFGLVWLGAGMVLAVRSKSSGWKWLGAVGTGLVVAGAWWFNFAVSKSSFEVVPVQGLSFGGPSAEWLMRVLVSGSSSIGFDFGLIPGVVLGSFIGALVGRELRLEGFHDGRGMVRHLIGAVCMGLGASLAGGCAVGAGMTGGAIFALTAWLALFGMWGGAGVTNYLLDGRHQRPA